MTLTASERINAIKAIAESLENEGWAVINLTLNQFSAPTSDAFMGDTYDYVVAMLASVPDSVLSQLIAHLGFSAAADQTEQVPDFWSPRCFRLFASHLAEEKEYATSLQGELARLHITTFVAHKDITPSLAWQSEIRAALRSADALVALLTPKFHESDWTDQEVGFVMGRNGVAVAVRLGRDPYGFMGSVQAFQGFGKPVQALAKEIFEAFLTNKQTSDAMGEALVSQFEASDSYIASQANVKLLQRIKYPTPRFTNRVLLAVEWNNQISGANRVAERAKELVQNWPSPDNL